jgi:hypothetical protein
MPAEGPDPKFEIRIARTFVAGLAEGVIRKFRTREAVASALGGVGIRYCGFEDRQESASLAERLARAGIGFDRAPAYVRDQDGKKIKDSAKAPRPSAPACPEHVRACMTYGNYLERFAQLLFDEVSRDIALVERSVAAPVNGDPKDQRNVATEKLPILPG